MKKKLLPPALALAIVALDQITKQAALQLSPGQRIPVIGDFISFQLTFNSGAAFSLGSTVTALFTLIAALAVIAIPVLLFTRETALSVRIIGAMIWGGAAGNLIDRTLREPGFPNGHVIDFINYNNWFIGNVADIFLVLALGAVLVMQFCPPSASEETKASEEQIN
ncbi:MAG: signal peptidase II [Trueperella sp.]|nr:signal peptidase II [Trueperella sp.]